MNHVAILDIGKTHIKLHLKSSLTDTLHARVRANHVLADGPYPHYDTSAIWEWLLEGLRNWSKLYAIDAIVITTHGATAALINRKQPTGDGLVLPVMDYEFDGVDNLQDEYDQARPQFTETASPRLPAGLNLGKQLFWMQCHFEDEFQRATDILTYPQYWAWRLCGNRCSEVTSLGCHTDLWDPHHRQWSSLVHNEGWRRLLPPLKAASDTLGPISDGVSKLTGLPPNCQVFTGIHDSNASYYRYKAALKQHTFTVLSTGTWCIAMNSAKLSDAEPYRLDEQRDMLMNVDADGDPIVCSRFMAGREAELLCQHLNGSIDEPYDLSHITRLIRQGSYCFPSWVTGTGPFPQHRGRVGGWPPGSLPVSAMISLYLALMIDLQLDLVHASNTIVLEGAYLRNPHLPTLLASLRPQQPLLTSHDLTGTVSGAYMLTQPMPEAMDLKLVSAASTTIPGLTEYRTRWRQRLIHEMEEMGMGITLKE
ncbi:hypothetical protein HBA55_27650 [Pseudomaricurvus alkylphenolicus]|uniref:FGGY-family carbohydrate kinase n=1 Tax=Pseudomaricurvus alkylphenolicus TaxID=1306991 RepID=UPI00141E4B0A|nr:FGGY family carbohydrate kinase [Pseudomaricurvus alkylphenolicus]NIB43415.1 hypothetical protein [Pseudomaricurvus alkylphenolicus]